MGQTEVPMFRALTLAFFVIAALPGLAKAFVFEAIEGGPLDLAAYRGGPVLVVNTASRCGFTYQYVGLQALWERYRDRGLTVVAVPSDDFRQELASNEAVKDFCEVNYGLTLPMTGITPVRGTEAHEFYRWLREAHGFAPNWNFNKVLLDADGRFVAGYRSGVRPEAPELVAAIEAALR